MCSMYAVYSITQTSSLAQPSIDRLQPSNFLTSDSSTYLWRNIRDPMVYHIANLSQVKMTMKATQKSGWITSSPSAYGLTHGTNNPHTWQGQQNFFHTESMVSSSDDALTFLPATDKACTLNKELPKILELISKGPNSHTSEETDHL